MTKKQEIFIAASKLFETKGYSASSMRELANHVGLEPSSLYSHINSKEEILRKICFDAANEYIAGLEKINLNFEDPMQKIEALIKLHIRIAIEQKSSITVFNDEWRHLSEGPLDDFKNLRRTYEKGFLTIIEQAQKEGKVKNIDKQIIFNTLINGMRWIYYSNKDIDKSKVGRLENSIVSLLLGGLVKQTN